MKVAIVILNWNGKALLERFLPSVKSNASQAGIYVIDNGSIDESVSFLEADYPEIEVIKLIENRGYAGGYNLGLKSIEADLFCLLNNDVRVDKNWLPPVIRAFENDQQLGAAQPTILDLESQDRFEYAGAAGGYIDRYGFPYCRGRIFETLETDTGQYNDEREIFWASGACFFIRKAVFDKLGGFDETFFAHMEEIDLCWRIRNAGFRIRHIHESKVFHLGGGTLGQNNPQKTFLNFRNSLYMLQKNLPAKSRKRIILSRLLIDGIAALKFLFQLKPKHSLAVFHAHLEFHRRKNDILERAPELKKIENYYHSRSVVWSYFVLGKRVFSSL